MSALRTPDIGNGWQSVGWEPPKAEDLLLLLFGISDAKSGENENALLAPEPNACPLGDTNGWKGSSVKKLLSDVGLPLWLLGGDISPEEPKL